MKLNYHSLFFLLAISTILVICTSKNEVNRDPERDLRQCEQRCQRQQPYFEEHKCRERCRVVEEGRTREDDADAVVWDAEKEYERCQRTCRGSGKEQWQCQRKCQDVYETALKRERQEREQERERERERERESGRGGDERHGGKTDREWEEKHCKKRCEDREEGFARQRQCKLHCEHKYGPSQHHTRMGKRERVDLLNKVSKHHKSKKEETIKNPYYFDSKSFEFEHSTKEGNISLLQRFSEKSDLLNGIDQFRLVFFEANPNTFMFPLHSDADSVMFVMQGKGALTFVTQENRQSFNIQRGDVLMIPAGTIEYLVSTQNDEKLQIVELLRPVNNPGQYELFYSVGSKQTESFLNSFSSDILEAALDVSKEELQTLFKQQKEGAIIKVKYDQVKALAQHGMSMESFGSSKGVFSLLNEEPIYANDHGEYYEVSPNDYQKLENLDVSVAYCDIKQGSMMAPNFNSRTTYIMFVEEGSGFVEMTCPHEGKESNKEQKERQTRSAVTYQKLRSNLSKGDAFVIPSGHPVVLVSSENENLRMVGFGINAIKNKKNFLAGQENVINQMEDEVKELSFEMPAREVEEMFGRQRNSYFMAGPQQRQQGKSPLLSALDFAGF